MTASISLRALETQLYQELNKLKTKLIRTKLDYMYNFVAEEAALEAFGQLKDELEDLTAQALDVQKKILHVTHNKLQRQTAKEKAEAMEVELSKMYAEVTRQDVGAINTVNRAVTELAKERRMAKYNHCAVLDETTGLTLYEEKVGESNPGVMQHAFLPARLVEEPYTLAQMYIKPLAK